MPDPTGELPPSSRQPPDPAHPAAQGEPAHLHPAPRLHPVNAHHAADTPSPATSPSPPPDLGDLLEWMRRNGLPVGTPASPAGTPPVARGQLSKEHRKFHKFDPEHPSLAPEGDRPRVSESSAREESGDPSERITAERQAYMRRLREQTPEQTPWLPVGLAVLVFLLVLGAFLLGHFTFPKMFPTGHAAGSPPDAPVVESKALNPLPGGIMEILDRAAVAETTQDYPQAIQLLETAQRGAGHIYGLNYRLASLCYKANQMPRVVPLLNLSINQGEEVAACYSLRGVLTNQYEATEHGPGDLEKATLLDPLNARYFFVWGEALRRADQPEQALVQLRRAVDRLQEPDLVGLYSLKLRLAQIALNDEDQFAAGMATELAQVPPPVDWLWTAAALELHRGHFPAAVDFLQRIRAAIGAQATARQLQDVFFAKYAHEKSLADFFEAADAAFAPAESTPR